MAITQSRAPWRNPYSIEYSFWSPVFTPLSLLGLRLGAEGSCWDVKEASAFTRWSLTERRGRRPENSWECIIFHCQIALKCQFWQITPSFKLISPRKCLFFLPNDCAWMCMCVACGVECSHCPRSPNEPEMSETRAPSCACELHRFIQPSAAGLNGSYLNFYSFH